MMKSAGCAVFILTCEIAYYDTHCEKRKKKKKHCAFKSVTDPPCCASGSVCTSNRKPVLTSALQLRRTSADCTGGTESDD